MINEAEHNPINAVLIPFQAHLIKMKAARQWGVDVSGLMVGERKLLTLFASMVMGTMKPPENWREIDIFQKYYPCIDQWEMFFSGWLDAVKSDPTAELDRIGIDIINFENPYDNLLIDLIGLTYGPEAEGDVNWWLSESNTRIYRYADGNTVDLSSPQNFALHFKESYDTQTFTESYESNTRYLNN